MESPEVALAPFGGVTRMVVSPAEVKARLKELQEFVKAYMVPGQDYGIIPGSDKPSLWKSGAEKLLDVYALTPQIAILEKIVQDDYISYSIKVTLVSRQTGTIIAEGVGNCNTHESRYRWRWVWEADLPPAYTKAKGDLRTRTTKKGARQYRIPNEEVGDLHNTILKQAKKRALVDAVLTATRSSALFTQDIEDFVDGYAEDGTEPETPANARRAFTAAWSSAVPALSEPVALRLVETLSGGRPSKQWTATDYAAAGEVLSACVEAVMRGATPLAVEQVFMQAGSAVGQPWGPANTQAGLSAVKALGLDGDSL